MVANQFKLDLYGDHGIWHWKRVEAIGAHLWQGHRQANIKVIRLFAVLHDSRRENESEDPDHGERAAQYTKELLKQNIIRLPKTARKQLIYACRYHNDKDAKTDDITVKICWDSDRLDLFRLFVQPDPSRLLTNEAKMPEILKFIQSISIGKIS